MLPIEKARSGLLETARLNLTESASKKAQTINEWIDFNKSGLTIATNNIVLQPENLNSILCCFLNFSSSFLPWLVVSN